ncbi:T9SS C-terminal target domain-containing protein [candidate division KSB1 bacterium]|nr:MAG: T9SS C-terminal target domain-containing protein [candidate division KSB1 bacterium]
MQRVIILLIVLLAAQATFAEERTVAIDGYCYLERQTDHSGTKVKFIADPSTPLAQTDSVYTNAAGYFIIPELQAGYYDVEYTHLSYNTYLYANQYLLGGRTLPSVTLACQTLSGNVRGVVGPGCCTMVGDITIVAGDTLRIMPGTTLYFQWPFYFRIYGTLWAVGTQSDSIVFTRLDGNGWRGLRFFNAASSGSRMDYCVVERGRGYGSNYWEIYGGGVFCENTSPHFTWCVFRNNFADADNGHGGAVFCHSNSNPVFDHCTFIGNAARIRGGAVYCNQSSSAEFNNCLFNGNWAQANDGGGMACGYSSPRFDSCRFSNNQAGNTGGGIWCYNCSPSFTGCVINNNSAQSGGGIMCEQSSMSGFTNCSIQNNRATNGHGGGVYSSSASPSFSGCTLANNVASQWGGGAYCAGSSSPSFTSCQFVGDSAESAGGVICYNYCSAVFTNCLFKENKARGWGGGVHCYMNSSPRFVHCTVSANRAYANYGSGVVCASASPVFISTVITSSSGYNLLFQSSPSSSFRYCDIFASGGTNIGNPSHGPTAIGQLLGTNSNGDSSDIYLNIFNNPLFVDEAGGDLHLKEYSPCIGAGDPVNPPVTDFEGNLRPNPAGSHPDIGAYENERDVPLRLCGSLSGILGPGVLHVTCPIQVNTGDSLLLMPNTTIIFDGPYPFDIYGTLMAEGTAADSIYFRTDTLANPDRWRGLRFFTGSSGSRLSYCSIKYGLATGEGSARSGGGIYCEDTSPVFTHCAVFRNHAYENGGGIACGLNAQPEFLNCTISGNRAENDGGGTAGNGVYSHCTISGNKAVQGSGGTSGETDLTDCIISINEGYSSGGFRGGTFTRCTVSGNRALAGAGAGCQGMFIDCRIANNIGLSGPGGVLDGISFTNCVISGNSGSVGALEIHGSTTFYNCTINGNTGANGIVRCIGCSAVFNSSILSFSNGIGAKFDGDCSGCQFHYCDFYGNSGGNFAGSIPAGLGSLTTTNINGDPCDATWNVFVAPAFVNAGGGDFHLSQYSRCLGAGDPTNPPPLDMEGTSRPNPDDSNPDIGAYESPLNAPLPLDHGDLAACNYPTLFGNPAHVLSEIAWLGAAVSGESSPKTNNLDTYDDGVVFLYPPWTYCRMQMVQVAVTAGPNYQAYADTGGVLYLSAWKDGNLDGDFCDTINCGEQLAPEWIIQDLQVTPGVWTISLYDPGDWHLGFFNGVFRFRLTSQPVGPLGFGKLDPAACPQMVYGTYDRDILGEVEDYILMDFQTSVELLGFEAIAGDGEVRLTWETASETDNDHFEALRDGRVLAEVRGAGSSTVAHRYQYVDHDLTNGVTYNYILMSVDINGIREQLSQASAVPLAREVAITEYALHQNYPNPFNAATHIVFDLPENGHVQLRLYNLMGQQVAEPVNGPMLSGRHTIRVDAGSLASGEYLYRLAANGFTSTKKLLIIK